MGILLTLAFLFFIGSLVGWIIEVIFRRFFSAANPKRKWINPGFCTGPYLPLYGFGLCFLYLIASLQIFDGIKNTTLVKILIFVIMTVTMTILEYIAGILSLKVFKVRLWDYSDQWGNIQGIICPKFSLFWAILGAVYYFLVHPHILTALNWLSHNLAFSFVIGMFYGVFLIDVVHSTQIIAKLKKFAEENDVIVRYENIKAHIRWVHEQRQLKYHFFLPFQTEHSLHEYLTEHKQSKYHKHLFENRIPKTKNQK